jgi:hypothetical protein
MEFIMPLPIFTLSATAPVAFDLITTIMLSISSAIVSGTSVFFITKNLNPKNNNLVNQGEKALSEARVLLAQTTENTQELQTNFVATNNLMQHNITTINQQINILSSNTHVTNTTDLNSNLLNLNNKNQELIAVGDELSQTNDLLREQQKMFNIQLEKLTDINSMDLINKLKQITTRKIYERAAYVNYRRFAC